METLPNSGRTILVVLAHPDDETFGMGGTLAYYGHLGAEVHLVCATRGEVGEVSDEKMNGFNSIAELRENELCCAADVLKIRKVHFLDYRDSGMNGSVENEHPDAFINAPIEMVAKELVDLMRRIKPDIVLTFDPIGGYMHPDHIMAHNATVMAFGLCSDPDYEVNDLAPFAPKRLYFHIIPRGFFKIVVRLMPLFGVDPSRFGNNKDINLLAIVEKDFPIHAKINYRRFARLRDQASACHASQGGDKQSGFIVTWLLRIFQSVEAFMQAYPPYEKKKPRTDLFEGL
jgi:N-acetyl-1-D-myo-inositol-2-amino-2-deoxy-alpha-D-glucopyranoside deacetylase